MRTKQEVINFLESKVGTTVPCPGRPDLDGQCVTLVKTLMEFLGVPNPYKARGHAKTVISAYLSEGIADPGVGFISAFSNKNMGDGYGHIWLNAGEGSGTYYESNGAKPLTVTKGKTYSYDNVCNFDKYIGEGGDMGDDYGDAMWKSEQHDKTVKELFGDDKNPRQYTSEQVVEVSKNLENEVERLEIDKNKLAEDLEKCQFELEKCLLGAEVEFKVTGKKKIQHPDGQETIETTYKVKEG